MDDIDDRGYGFTRHRAVDAENQRKARLYVVLSQQDRYTLAEIKDLLEMLGLIPDEVTSNT